jgi:hypothetical protein
MGEEGLVLVRNGALTVLSACGVRFEFITDSEFTTGACCSRLDLEISSLGCIKEESPHVEFSP